MPPVLLATCAAMPDGDEDAAVLEEALARVDVAPRWVPWTDVHTDWDEALVVLRSTWDYSGDRERFVSWSSGLRRVANASEIVAWNTDKTYLADLAASGVPTVQSTFAPPGTPVTLPDADEIVVKPSIGAGSRGAGRFVRARFDAARTHAEELQRAGRVVLVQHYLRDVETAGETALIYFDGRFSHAIRKGPLLPEGTVHPVDGWALFVQEVVTARTPDPAELEVGALAMQAVRDRFDADPLYTRVDLLPSADGPVVNELELTEPSLYLQHGVADESGETAADRFARAIAGRA